MRKRRKIYDDAEKSRSDRREIFRISDKRDKEAQLLLEEGAAYGARYTDYEWHMKCLYDAKRAANLYLST